MVLRRSLPLAALVAMVLAGTARPLAAAGPTIATLAHIKLTGSLDEAPVAADPFFGSTSENFKSKLDRIKKAKDDSSIQGLLLQIDDLSLGWGKVDELHRAIADFRASGKKAYAYLESGSTKDYVVAASCDEIGLPESGWLMLTGLRMEVTFYKDLFDKIGVKADMLQMGDFKGAAEPFTRSGMSKEFRGQLETVLDDYFNKSLVGQIAEARSAKKPLTPEQVKKLIDEGPYSAKRALEAGLIDRVAYFDGLPDQIKEGMKAERVKLSRNYGQSKSKGIDFTDFFNITKLLNPTKAMAPLKPNKIAVIYATGVITTGKSRDSFLAGETMGSTTMIEAIRQAEQDKTVKAIVLRVDSPGGSALASDLIWNELRRSKKPVVASMSDTAASGGYYISMAAQKIYAEPGTLTGSIGVVGGKFVLAGLYDKIGLKTETLSRGANANLLSFATPFSDGERKAWLGLMRDTYDQFLDKAIQGRRKAGKDLTRETLEKDLAGGRVWTGRQAKANGLVDELGTLDDAVAAAKKMANLAEGADVDLLILPEAKGLLETLLDMKSEEMAPALGARQLLGGLPEVADKLRPAASMLRLRSEPVWLLGPCRIDVR
jgi:protease-4